MQLREVACPACRMMVAVSRIGFMEPHTGHPVFSGSSFAQCPAAGMSWYRAERLKLLGRLRLLGDRSGHVRRPEAHVPDARL